MAKPIADNTRADKNGSNAVRGAVVLLVEDDEDIRDMSSAVLRRAGVKVHTADSTGSALEQVRSTTFDAAVMDWNLQDQTGSDILTVLRDQHPKLFQHTIVVTGDLLSIPGRHDAETFGRPVLAKPFRPSDLVAALRDLLIANNP